MRVEYSNKKIEKICTSAIEAKKHYGVLMARMVQLRLKEIKFSESVEEMILNRIGKCHLLNGNRKNQYAVSLIQPYRLVFTVIDDVIQIATIQEIVDYH